MANRGSQQQQKEQKAFDVVPVQGQLVAAEPEFRRLAVAAARNVDYHREMNFALAKVKESEALQKCHQDSFREAFENLASTGLSLNPNYGQAALVPRWNAKRRCNWATVMPMYRGFIALATGGKRIKNVWGAEVLDGDDFKMIRGSHPRIEHVTPLRKKGGDRIPSPANMLGAYVCAEIEGSAHPHITWMDIDQLLAVAERSESYNPKERDKYEGGQKVGRWTPPPSGPWVTDFGQMCVKSVFRRGWKTWPGIDAPEYAALSHAVRVETEAEVMEQHREPEPQQEGGTLVVTAEQAKELNELALAKRCRPQVVLNAYGVDSFEAIPAEKFAEVKKRLENFGRKA
jgi:recombinational DNA repair protein RecT